MKRQETLYRKYAGISLPWLFTLCIIILTSCASTEMSRSTGMKSGTKHYENPGYAVILDYPADWYFKEADGLLFASISSFDITVDGGAGLAIFRMNAEDAQKEFEDMTPDTVIKSFMNALNAVFSDIMNASIGGVESRKVEFTISRGNSARGEMNICIFNQHVYIFLAMVNPPEAMGKYEQVFTDIYESFEFIQDTAQM